MIKQRKNVEIRNKFINHLIFNGKKSKSEKIISRSVKALQTVSKKSSQKLVQLALIYNTPVFKLNVITQKKRKKKKQKARVIPAFICNQASRASFAIKLIVKTAKKKKQQSLFKKLTEELLLTAQNKSDTIQMKKETQKQALLSRHLFKYYRWH